MKTFISIATYNEKENIEKLIHSIFGLNIADLNIVITDDNSPDGTSDIIRQLKNQYENLYLIQRTGKLGYGSAHIAGFNLALKNGAEVIISMDADFSHDPKEIPNLISEIKEGSDVVVGSRRISGGKVVDWSLWRKFCSAGAMFASHLVLGIKTKDLTSGYRAYKRRVLEKINLDKIKSDGYSFLEEVIYKIEKMGFKVKEIPIIFHDRRLGYSKLSKTEIIKFFITIFKVKSNSIKDFRFTFENSTIILIGITFFIGIWYALPMLKIVGDEMYFVGGVFRAMENRTILPLAGDVPYGTLTYFLNYILISIYVVILLPFHGFDISSLKLFLTQFPEYAYIVPRFLSALLSLIYLKFFYKIIKKEFTDNKIRILLLILLFTNMLITLILHTGKMWVLSTLLVFISIYYLYQALNLKQTHKNIFLSILFSFLAFVNFPLNAFALINVPIILIFFRKDKATILKTFKYTLIGLAIFLILTLANYANIKDQVVSIFTHYRPVANPALLEARNNLTPLESLGMFFLRTLAFYPLIILTILLSLKNKIKNKNLFILGMVYFLAYLITISILATWASIFYSYIRYVFPLGFFLILILISCNIKFSKFIHLPIIILSLIYFIPTLYFLSVPTTFNQARNYVIQNLNQPDTIIQNELRSLELPKNKQSYEIVKDEYCASKCKNIIKHDLNSNFKPLLIDKYTQDDYPVGETAHQYLITDRVIEDKIPVVGFTNRTGIGYDLDGRMANYFDFNFFTLKNFGHDIFIYVIEE